MNVELHEIKRKFFEQKRREAIAREKELSTIAEEKLFLGQHDGRVPSNKIRYTGGGFAIK